MFAIKIMCADMGEAGVWTLQNVLYDPESDEIHQLPLYNPLTYLGYGVNTEINKELATPYYGSTIKTPVFEDFKNLFDFCDPKLIQIRRIDNRTTGVFGNLTLGYCTGVLFTSTKFNNEQIFLPIDFQEKKDDVPTYAGIVYKILQPSIDTNIKHVQIIYDTDLTKKYYKTFNGTTVIYPHKTDYGWILLKHHEEQPTTLSGKYYLRGISV